MLVYFSRTLKCSSVCWESDYSLCFPVVLFAKQPAKIPGPQNIQNTGVVDVLQEALLFLEHAAKRNYALSFLFESLLTLGLAWGIPTVILLIILWSRSGKPVRFGITFFFRVYIKLEVCLFGGLGGMFWLLFFFLLLELGKRLHTMF